ncbi:caspase family protein, partial [Amycolatopsis tolypomycina]|uniref:caspase family protein n=1 Tax=Amycolatopsis tolypomycina TaxID=208445 RepID=UPI0033BDAD69
MSRARFPAAAASRAVLIGVSRYESAALPPLPAVRTNLSDLRAALTDPTTGTLNRSGCRTLGDNATPAEVGRALAEASREASDLLLVYYAGHGVLDEDGTLHLALRTTSEDHPGWTALPITLVKRELARARARARVLVVDSCFSGQAIEAMAAPAGLVAGQLRLTGTYTLTSVPANEPSKAPIGARHTAFTGALLDALASPEPLTLDEIYRHTDETLAGLGLPRPQRGAVNSASDLALVRGPLARLKAVGAGADLAAAPLPGRTPDVVVPAPYPEPTPGTAAPRPNQPEAAPAPQPEPTPSPATPHANQPEAAPAPQPEPTPSPATPRPNQPEAAPAPQPEPTPSPATPRPNQPEAAPAPR